jgi:hypothetical protein
MSRARSLTQSRTVFGLVKQRWSAAAICGWHLTKVSCISRRIALLAARSLASLDSWVAWIERRWPALGLVPRPSRSGLVLAGRAPLWSDRAAFVTPAASRRWPEPPRRLFWPTWKRSGFMTRSSSVVGWDREPAVTTVSNRNPHIGHQTLLFGNQIERPVLPDRWATSTDQPQGGIHDTRARRPTKRMPRPVIAAWRRSARIRGCARRGSLSDDPGHWRVVLVGTKRRHGSTACVPQPVWPGGERPERLRVVHVAAPCSQGSAIGPMQSAVPKAVPTHRENHLSRGLTSRSATALSARRVKEREEG